MVKSKEIAKVAYHEAGHIVIAWLSHLPIGKKGVCIKPDPKQRGKFIGNSDISRPDPDDLNKTDACLYMLFAGLLSEKLFLDSIHSDDHLDTNLGAENDYEKKIKNIFAERNPEGLNGIKFIKEQFERYEPVVKELLSKCEIWNAVKLVAEELIEKHHLKKSELYEIMEKLSLGRIKLTGDLICQLDKPYP